MLLYLTKDTTPRELAEAMDRSSRQVRRITSRLLEYGLITDRQHIKLVDSWPEVWEHLAVEKGSADKKQAAERKLAQDRLTRKRALPTPGAGGQGCGWWWLRNDDVYRGDRVRRAPGAVISVVW
jgi:hypothetical protein